MKLNIDTNFDIGDIVYAADHYYDYYANHRPYVVTDIVVNVNNDSTRTMCGVERDGVANRFPEEWLFRTYEECLQWCEAQNKRK